MPNKEIEIKLTGDAKTLEALWEHPALAGENHTAQRIENTYYDTADLRFSRKGFALRLRVKNGFFLTVKTDEAAKNGLSTRREWEWAVDSKTAADITSADWQSVDDVAIREMILAAAPYIKAIFTTHFLRNSRKIIFGETLIEAAFDVGNIESEGRVVPIAEIELELLAGKVSDLEALAHHLQKDLPELCFSTESKALRGYQLFTMPPKN